MYILITAICLVFNKQPLNKIDKIIKTIDKNIVYLQLIFYLSTPDYELYKL
jgi:hypothetical protein